MAAASLVALAALSVFLFILANPGRQVDENVSRDDHSETAKEERSEPESEKGASKQELFMYCAAGMRYPMEEIAKQYKDEYGVDVQLQYGGSNTLLSQLEVSRTGDLYLAGDDFYTLLAQQKGLVEERIPLARMRPVIAVRSDHSKRIASVDDLLADDVKVALGDPDAAAIGKKTRQLLSASGKWPELQKRVTVFKPTVNDVANATKLGSVDAGIVWDSTAAQYHDLRAVRVPELDVGAANIEVAVVSNSKSPTAALRFARYVAASDKGLKSFATNGFEPVDGDVWAEYPELTFFAGSVNRRALDPIVREFERREGVTVNTVYNGCGILTAQMRALRKGRGVGFPDTYMACDVYYLNTVKEWFQDAVNVSDTDIVLVVQKGNPKGIRTVNDLLRPGVRVALGQPEQCTIGVLSRRLLQSEGVYQKLLGSGNVVTETQTSALLVPNITTGAADAVLAYRTDTKAERNRLHVVDIDSPLAKAIQPYGIARSSEFKYLGRRLFDRISKSRDSFESAGFNWRLDAGRRRGVENKRAAPSAANDDSQ
jgi:molybdenum ABC transporter molybdate-binding protein